MSEKKGLPWWAWVPFIPILVTLVILWRMRQRAQKRVIEIEHPAILLPDEPVVEPSTAAVRAPSQEDNLVILEGIGPKISAVLKSAGIDTFHQLASTPVERLREILLAANLRLPDPTTWPEQAALAAQGDWEGFKALTAQLKGGRKVK
jgi:predicted flap endonuclease-1-like 5' DNA nuclease